MRILAITSKFSGVGYHRIMLPLVHMQKDYCLITDTLSEEIVAKGWDIFLMNRFLADINIQDIIDWRKKYGFKLVVDNDDFWQLDPTHVLYHRYEANGITDRILQYIKIADLNTCTHERLAEAIYQYNPNVEILPNALPYGEEQFLDNKIESDKLRLFWAGSGTHEKDLKILKEPLKRLIGKNVKMILAGYNESEGDIWNYMAYYFSAGRKLDTHIYRYTDVTRYMAAYADSDVSLIPLVESKFNGMKSNLKVLETAAKKNPAIVSNVHPYKDLPVLYVNKQSDWNKHINSLLRDDQMRIGLGQELFDYCSKHYNFKEINSKRNSIYSKLL